MTREKQRADENYEQGLVALRKLHDAEAQLATQAEELEKRAFQITGLAAEVQRLTVENHTEAEELERLRKLERRE